MQKMQELTPTDQREDEASKLEALKEAARIGIEDLERGAFEEFESVEDLRAYPRELS